MQISYKHFLYFVPLLVLISIKLWNGVKINLPVEDSICYLVYMLGVGVVEEVSFHVLRHMQQLTWLVCLQMKMDSRLKREYFLV